MFDISFSELLVFGAIALVVLGPEKLPQAARSAGRWYAKIRRTVSNLQSELENELDLAETRKQLQQELDKIRQSEADMQRQMAELKGNWQRFEQAKEQSPNISSTANTDNADKNPHVNHTPFLNQPLTNVWFRLGEYDRKRRLPSAPFLPNYQADVLLNIPLTANTFQGDSHQDNGSKQDSPIEDKDVFNKPSQQIESQGGMS